MLACADLASAKSLTDGWEGGYPARGLVEINERPHALEREVEGYRKGAVLDGDGRREGDRLTLALAKRVRERSGSSGRFGRTHFQTKR